MSSINNKSKSFPGLSAVYFVLEKDIVAAPVSTINEDFATGSFILSNLVSFEPIYFVQSSSNFNENESTKGLSDSFYKTTLSFRNPLANAVSQTFIEKYKNRKVTAVILDRNKNYRVIRKAMVSIKESTGAVGGGFNGYNFTLSSMNIHKSIFLQTFNP